MQISEAEVRKYLKGMHNNVAPGSSCYTGNFYKAFWTVLKQRIMHAIHRTNTFFLQLNIHHINSGMLKIKRQLERQKTNIALFFVKTKKRKVQILSDYKLYKTLIIAEHYDL